MKKHLATVILIYVMLALTACGSSKSSSEDSDIAASDESGEETGISDSANEDESDKSSYVAVTDDTNGTDSGKGISDIEEFLNAYSLELISEEESGYLSVFDTSAEIAETIIYDSENICVSIAGLSYSDDAVSLVLYIENNSDTDILCLDSAVNYMPTGTFLVNNYYIYPEDVETTVPAGESMQVLYQYNYEDLLWSGINSIANIQAELILCRDYDNGDFIASLSVDASSSIADECETSLADNLINSSETIEMLGGVILSSVEGKAEMDYGVLVPSAALVQEQDGSVSFLLELKNETEEEASFMVKYVSLNDQNVLRLNRVVAMKPGTGEVIKANIGIDILEENNISSPEDIDSASIDAGSYSINLSVSHDINGTLDLEEWTDIVEISQDLIYGNHSVGLKSDGTVVAYGKNGAGQCNVGGWTDIISVAAGGGYTAGLKSDGTVVAVGSNNYGQTDVENWTDMVALEAKWVTLLGLRSDGTILIAGQDSGIKGLTEWTDIVDIATTTSMTIGLKSDGSIVASSNLSYEDDLGDWQDVIDVVSGMNHLVGLKSDGTVVAVGSNGNGECDVDDWTDIVSIAAGPYCTVGIKSDGTIVVAGDTYVDFSIDAMQNVQAAAVGGQHVLFLKTDGTVKLK